MTDRSKNIAVGITAILGALGLGTLMILFGAIPSWMSKGYTVQVNLDTAGGLTQGSRVKLSGIDVGRIESVELLTGPPGGVKINAYIREEVRLPEGLHVRVEQGLLGGTPALGFEPPTMAPDQSVTYLPTDGSATVKGESYSFMSAFAGELQGALAEPTRQFTRMSDNFERMATEWAKVGSNLAQLTEVRNPDDVDKGEAKANLATVLTRADQRLADMKATLEGMKGLFGDEKFRQDIKDAAANAKVMTEKVGNLATSADEKLDKLVQRYVAVADDLSGAITSMKQTIDLAKNGDGTIGKLLNDATLYNNLNDASARLRKALDEFRQLLDKIKSEGLPVKM
ncbi:MAG: MCE family protein [Phycisphaera sp.]|nr:MCE family protein [Phycisphaera sp.]